MNNKYLRGIAWKTCDIKTLMCRSPEYIRDLICYRRRVNSTGDIYAVSSFWFTALKIFLYKILLHADSKFIIHNEKQYIELLHRQGPGARLAKANDVTIQRYRNSHATLQDSKMYILQCMGSKVCEISKVPFEISHQILNQYTAKYAFYEVVKIDNLWHLRVMTS